MANWLKKKIIINAIYESLFYQKVEAAPPAIFPRTFKNYVILTQIESQELFHNNYLLEAYQSQN